VNSLAAVLADVITTAPAATVYGSAESGPMEAARGATRCRRRTTPAATMTSAWMPTKIGVLAADRGTSLSRAFATINAIKTTSSQYSRGRAIVASWRWRLWTSARDVDSSQQPPLNEPEIAGLVTVVRDAVASVAVH
jgi:hypothetical protein